MANKVFTDESLATLVDETKSYVDEAVSGKSDSNHTHNYAGSSSAGGAATSANKVNSSLTVKLNGGSTEGTNLFTFNGSAAKSVNITPSAIGAAASSHNHDDRYYTESEIDGKISSLNTAISGKSDSGHTHSISNITNLQTTLDGKVPTTRTVNGKALSADITLTASDVGASASGHTHSAYVNQNAFSNVTVGDTTIAADSTTDTLTIAAGTGISVSADTTNDKVTITNSGVRSISTGSSNGTISVNTNGSSTNVAVKGLGSAAYTASTAYDAAGTAQTKADAALASAKTYTDEKIDAIVGEGASTTLDTIGEISAAIEEHQDVTDALNAAIGNKVDKVSGKGLSTNDYTTTEKNKLAGIATGANNYTHPTTSGNKHIPSGGSSGQILRWSADGTAVWGEDNNTTYGVATSSALGLVKSGTDITVDSSGNVSVNDDSHNHVISNVDGLQTALDGKAPTSHASTSTTYGAGTSSNYGHVKLSDSTSSTSGTSGGIAATPSAVKSAYDLANTTKTELDELTSEFNAHTHGASDITSGVLNAARLPVASNSASGIVNTSSQTFAGAKTFSGKITASSGITTGGSIISDTANTDDIGSGSIPFDATYTRTLNVSPKSVSGSIILGGSFGTTTEGTTTTDGFTELKVGNAKASGTNGNSQGLVQLYNSSTGSVTLQCGHSTSSDYRVYLPSGGGTLALNSTFVKSGSGAKSGLVPAPSTTAGTTKYLREDGTWAVPQTDLGLEPETWTFTLEDGATVIKEIYVKSSQYIEPPAPSTISFTIDGNEYEADTGMTWTEWVDSGYNTGGFTIMLGSIRGDYGLVVQSSNKVGLGDYPQDPEELIIEGFDYVTA